MKIKTIVSRYLRGVPADCIKHLENGVSEIIIDEIKIYINEVFGQSNLGKRYLISDRGQTLQGLKLDFKTFYKIIKIIPKCSENGVIFNICNDSQESLLLSVNWGLESYIEMIQKIKQIIKENNND